MNISVVIPNYNGAHLFPDTLPPLMEALRNSGKDFEIIIVDDYSTDDSVNFLHKHYPQIKLLRNKRNHGFSVTINKGIFAAGNELILLLNSDVKLDANYFEHQFRYFEMPDTFGVMGKITGWNDESIQDGAKYPAFQGFKLKTSGNYILTDPSGDQPVYSMYLSGANALISREKLLLLNGFDEIYSPFYMEDVDLSVRAWRTGLKCYFEPAAVCRHKTSSSISSKEKKIYVRTIYNRNKFYFHAIHLNGIRLAGWHAQTIVELLFRLITLKIYYLKAYMAFIKNRKHVIRSRSDLKALCSGTGNCISLPSIVRQIRRSVTGRNKVFFRS